MLNDWARYVQERILIPKIGLLWLLLSAAIWFVGKGGRDFVFFAAAHAALFILAFRLMDDLADRTHDAVLYPQRCLVRSRHIPSFVALAGLSVIALAVLASLTLGARVGLGMLGLAAILFLLGRAHSSGGKSRAIAAKVALLKYPALILLVAVEPVTLKTLAVACVLLLAPLADEILDRRSG